MTATGMLGTARKAFDFIVLAANFLASVMIFGLMLLMVADVALRFFFNSPITGVNEMMEIAIVAMLYMQVTQALKDNRHTRSDAFFSTVSRRNPAAGRMLTVLFSLAGLCLMAAIVWVGVPGVRESYANHYTIGTHGVFIVPEWPVRAVIVFGCTLMGIEFAMAAARELRALLGGQASAMNDIEGKQDAWI
jgi:TRAP-type mannitol/chloroaromatic compound transport system permease small subunit